MIKCKKSKNKWRTN